MGKTAKKQGLSVNDSKIKGLWIWRRRFGTEPRAERDEQFKCGDFSFDFYIFDFSLGMTGRYGLSRQEKGLLKEHRIYLYRDGVRVFPYGNPDDDWLEIDISRGIGKVGDFFSNDQIIGWVDITQEKNPGLIDKTSREGLIRNDATADFLFLVPTFLSYVKQYLYERYKHSQEKKNIVDLVRKNIVFDLLEDLRLSLEEKGYRPEEKKVKLIESEYTHERNYFVQRAEITEDLAGVGLSVETTSHDIMLMMTRAKEIGIEIAELTRDLKEKDIRQKADILVQTLTNITDGMLSIQSLFKSAQRRRRQIQIEPVLDKMHQLHQTLLEKKGITYEKIVMPGPSLVVSTTDGVVMQVLINLFDNAIYWFETIKKDDKCIKVSIDGNSQELIFADNGPGVDKKDSSYIFEPFYSGKGQEGRGLGLYIARQLLERQDYGISFAEPSEHTMPGANFIVRFRKEDC